MASLNKTRPRSKQSVAAQAASVLATASVTPANTYGSASHNYRTHEGAQSYNVSALEELRRSVLSCMLWENTFYEKGSNVANRIAELVKQVDPEDVVRVAYEARTAMKLRHVPLFLTVEMLNSERHKGYVRKTVPLVVNRADEMAELLSMYWRNELVARREGSTFSSQRAVKRVPMQLLRGIRDAFVRFDDYQLTKYLNTDKPVTMADVLRLVHPDPRQAQQNLSPHKRNTVSMAAVYKSIADGTARAPQNTWEVALSAGGREAKKGVFEELISTNQLPAMALLRNLRGMTEAGVEPHKIQTALENIKVERILPYRFITARKYAQGFSGALESAMFRCLDGVEKLPGKTIILIDNSGSMDARISAKSEMNRVQGATGLAILAREICENSEVMLFDQNTYAVVNGSFKCVNNRLTSTRYGAYSSRPRETAGNIDGLKRNYHDSSNLRGFALEDAISRVSKGGTDLGQAIDYINGNYDYDRIIVFTDEQSMSDPGIPNTSKGYIINVATYQTGVGYGPWVHINGFSEATLAYIAEYERQF